MKAYIHCNEKGDFFNVNCYVAALGFESLGFEIVRFQSIEEIKDLDKESICVGGIGIVRKRLVQLGIIVQDEIEYPQELSAFLNRKVWKAKLKDLVRENVFGIFVKPAITKLFTGKVIRQFSDYSNLGYQDDLDVWCSEPVELLTEWRCFVRYRELIDVRYYKGDWDNRLDLQVVRDAIKAYGSQPASFCMDFGVDSKGTYYLVEVNDGYSLGSYGMGPITYAKFLSARWSELTETEDQLKF